MTTSVRLLDDTSDQINLTGQKIKAAGYFGSGTGNHTAAFYLNDFSGRIIIEASLADNPEEGDWAPIQFDGENFIQFPLDELNPTGPNGDTGTIFRNFVGNYVWLRARLDRNHIVPYPPVFDTGNIKKILVSY